MDISGGSASLRMIKGSSADIISIRRAGSLEQGKIKLSFCW